MRKQLLLSTGIICLMLAPAVSYGQGPGARGGGEEQKQMRPSDSGKGAASQERGERAQERGRGAEQRTQGAAGREERGAGSRQTEERGKAAPSERPTAASEDSKRGRGDDAKRATEQTKGARPGDREADRGRDAKESAKDTAKDSAKDRTKGTAESERTKSGTTTSQKEREGATTTQKEPSRDQRDRTSKDAAEQDKETGRPATATDTTRTQTQTGQMQDRQQLSTDKQVRISERLTRERLAPPQRNLNVSIRVGERIPRHVRVQRLPAAIVSIEPAYRGYDYFTTEEEIVIVEPGTQRIVSQIPRDASRIRAAAGEAAGSGRGADAMAQAGGAPCRIMRRDTAGNVTEVSPTTVGSTAPQDSISVTVRAPGGAGSTNPIALGASDGQIVVAMQGGDCTVTIEPQTR
ncbi:DUF1236 domain-containing protein [Bradyrhizobium sp. LMTR 3]|uniref:DUF1236 domain-containing protein n=1 Tax=Bradyrhizobium sp. LMTR 3 TaxID=189873 RepID=UPI000810D5F0|nr:DUF1236 domain-containing protein [Bradyrhizobium sp. LMTR 3]OCK59229.1 hypothetical protein LMTR3_06175 [Bradyrhizobium sp. LMTR 3]